jgi:hypothetical protein
VIIGNYIGGSGGNLYSTTVVYVVTSEYRIIMNKCYDFYNVVL